MELHVKIATHVFFFFFFKGMIAIFLFVYSSNGDLFKIKRLLKLKTGRENILILHTIEKPYI